MRRKATRGRKRMHLQSDLMKWKYVALKRTAEDRKEWQYLLRAGSHTRDSQQITWMKIGPFCGSGLLIMLYKACFLLTDKSHVGFVDEKLSPTRHSVSIKRQTNWFVTTYDGPYRRQNIVLNFMYWNFTATLNRSESITSSARLKIHRRVSERNILLYRQKPRRNSKLCCFLFLRFCFFITAATYMTNKDE